MKVELLVNLKIASGKVISAGTVYSDEVVPIPDFIMRRLARGTAKIIDAKPSLISKAPAVFPGSKAAEAKAAKVAEAKAVKAAAVKAAEIDDTGKTGDAANLGDREEAFAGNNFPKTIKKVVNKTAKE